MPCLALWSLPVITEAAILKKHNLFEDNMALPSESVSSLTDLKTSMGSNQASPARRVSAVPPGAPDNEVFQEPEEKKQQPAVPDSLAGEESTPIPESSPPSGGDGQETVSSVVSSAGSALTAEDTAGPLSSHAPEEEGGETLRDEEPTCERPESITTPGSLKELKELLTVTVSMESVPVMENDTLEGTPVPPENEKEEDSQTAALQQDNREESEVREKEAHPTPLEVEVPGDLETLPEASIPTSQSTDGGLSEDTSCLGPFGEPPEAPEPTEKVPPAMVSTQETTHAGGEAVHAAAVTLQEDAALNSNPVCSVERNEVSGDQEVLGGGGSPALAVDTEPASAAQVHSCQWVVEDAPGSGSPDVSNYEVSSPEQPSEVC